MDPRFEDIYPLTPMQRGILFHTLYSPGSGVYVNQVFCTFHGDVDEQALERSWQDVVDNNAILRTAFVWKRAAEPQQIVAKKAKLHFSMLDWSDVGDDEQQRRLAAFLEEDRRRGFNLAKPPLTRVCLIRLAPRKFKLVWTKHHLLIDGWSLQLLFGQVMKAYVRHLTGVGSPEPSPPPYKHYVAWLERQRAADAEDVWRGVLRGFTAPTRLDLDRKRTSSHRRDGVFTQVARRVPAELAEAVRSFATQRHLTINTLLQGAWALALSRYSGSDDVLFGATTSGRSAPIPGIESMVGVFINTIPVRVKIQPDLDAAEWLQMLQSAQARLRQFEHTPLTDVRRWSDVPPGEPLFESIVVFENYPIPEELQGPNAASAGFGIEIDDARSAEQINYPLTLVVTPGTFDLQLAYDERRFDTGAIEALLDHLLEVLRTFTSPGARVRDALRARAADRDAQLVTWNRTHHVHSAHLVHRIIEEVCRQRPDAMAVCGETQTTFGELNRRADQLAAHLRVLGVTRGQRVGVALPRSPELVTAFVAVLKAGAAFVPMDPDHPRDRLAFIASDAGIAVLITDAAAAARLRELAAQVVAIGEPWSDEPVAAGSQAWCPDEPAYVVYTSGSTGRPKAVLLTHRGLLNTSLALAASFEIGSESRVLQFASVGFDGCVGDVFSALVAGATLCIATREAASSGSAFIDSLRRQSVTSVTMPPSFARLIGPAETPALQVVACVGEACPAEVVERWQPGRRLINGYGPTEVTIAATLYDTRAGDPAPPIGYPIRNAVAYVCDEDQQPLPLGVTGELLLGGDGVALGYPNDGPKTADRFSPDGSSGAVGTRLYRTGDLARRAHGGALEYVGRSDDQVKVRGFRVELGEVESQLARCPFVEEAAVVVRRLDDGDHRLTAFVVLGSAPPPSPSDEIRAFVSSVLPEYMIPSAIVLREALPRNSSGKIDRKALSEEPVAPPGAAAPAGGGEIDEVERQLTDIWCRVLRVERVGRDEDFFRIAGGDSLLAVRMIAEVEKKLGRELPVSLMFESPTIAQLAAALKPTEDAPASATTAAFTQVQLDPSIRRQEPSRLGRLSDPEHVVVTGATGFLGAVVVCELLRRTRARVHCLVRATDSADARRRVAEALERYGLWLPEWATRVDAVPGDLAAPMLGVGAEGFSTLANTVDAIYHSGAQVHYLFPYDRLEGPNVLGTAEVLRLAARGRPKVVHHVSTLGVFPMTQRRGRPLTESEDPEPLPADGMGYAQSKWAAEALVREARSRNIPTVIYRPADVAGHSETGASNSADVLCLTLQACIRMKAVPDVAGALPIAPVDYVAAAIVEISLRAESLGGVFHLTNPVALQLADLVRYLEALGYTIEAIPVEAWIDRLRGLAGSSQDAALRRVLALLGAEGPSANGPEAQSWDFDCAATLRALASTSVRCPQPDESLVRTYVEYLVARGYLPAP